MVLGHGITTRRGKDDHRFMQTIDVEALVQTYLEALRVRDLVRCLDFFAKDAIIRMPSKIYQGKESIEKWHKARFAANVRVSSIERIKIQGQTAIVDAVISSDKLRAWDIRTVGGRATLLLDQGKVKDMKFGLRLRNPFNSGA